MALTPDQAPLPLDPYRILPSALRRPIQVFTSENAEASSSTSGSTPLTTNKLPSLLNLTPIAYSSRLSARQLLLSNPPPSTNPEAILLEASRTESIRRGRKRSIAQLDPGGVKHAAQEVRGAKRKAAGLIGRKEAKKRRLYKVKKGDKIDWADLQPLWWMHLGYLSDLLGLPDHPDYQPRPSGSGSGVTNLIDAANTSPHIDTKAFGKGKDKTPNTSVSVGQGKTNGMSNESILSKLIKCDMVGAMIKVKSAKSPNLIIHRGLVIQETAGTFKLVNRKSEVKVIPKNNSLITLTFPAYSYNTLLQSPGTQPAPTDGNPPESAPDLYALAYDPFLDPAHVESLAKPTWTDPGAKFEESLQAVPFMEIDILGSAFCFRTEDRAGRRFKPKEGGGGWEEDWVGWWGDEYT